MSKLSLIGRLMLLPFILVLAACPPTNTSTDAKDGEEDGATTTQAHMDVQEWVKLDSAIFGSATPAFYIAPIVSHDKKWLYLPTRGYAGSIVALDIGTDFNTNVQDKNAWSKLSWADASFSGSPGKGQLSDSGQTYTLNATSDGLLVAWRDTSGTKNHGALYVKGKKLAMAWQTVATHMLGFKTTKWNIDNFFAITKGNVAVPYVLATSPKNLGKSHLFTHTKLEESQFTTTAGFGTVANFSKAKFAQSATVAFLVSQNGISKLLVSDAGSATRFSAVAKNTPTFGSNAWNLGDPMTDNFNVSCVLVVNDKLYVGLDAVHDFQGGVAILDIATDTLIPPQKSVWNRVKVRHLFADSDGKVWAVTPKELIEVKSDGTMGEKLNAATVAAKQARTTGDNPQTGYKGEMPADDIFGAVAVGKSLLVTTDKNAYVLMNSTVAVAQ